MSLTHYLLSDYSSSPLDRLFDDVLTNRSLRRGQQPDIFRPRLDVHHDEDTNAVTATFELPGLHKEDVQIDIHNNILTVSGETKESSERNEEGYTHRERRYGKFSRSLTLPQGVKNEEVKANMTNGVLNITFPRSVPETTPARVSIT